MEQKILDYLTKERVACLATTLKDGSPHAAALHYSHSSEPLELYFSTENTSKKCQGILSGETTKASVVVGFSEQEFKTLQLDGQVSVVTDSAELVKIHGVHYAKFPESAKYKDLPESVVLKFIPSWWRYSDYKTKPLTVISSEE